MIICAMHDAPSYFFLSLSFLIFLFALADLFSLQYSAFNLWGRLYLISPCVCTAVCAGFWQTQSLATVGHNWQTSSLSASTM